MNEFERLRNDPRLPEYEKRSAAKKKSQPTGMTSMRIPPGERIMVDELKEALGMSQNRVLLAGLHGLYYAHFGIINPRGKKPDG